MEKAGYKFLIIIIIIITTKDWERFAKAASHVLIRS